MTNIARFVCQLSGWSGGPGVNVFHFSEGNAGPWSTALVTSAYDELVGMYEDIAEFILDDVDITVDEAPSIIDVASGDVVNVISVPAPHLPISGTGVLRATARDAQLCVRHNTDVWQYGRRLVGHSYLGPADGGIFTGTGAVDSGVRTTVQAAFAAMTSGLGIRLAVYSRPNAAKSRAGSYGDVVQATCLATPGTLRSRKV